MNTYDKHSRPCKDLGLTVHQRNNNTFEGQYLDKWVVNRDQIKIQRPHIYLKSKKIK